MTPSALLIKAEGSGTTPEVEERTLPPGPKVTNALEAKPVRVAVASAVQITTTVTWKHPRQPFRRADRLATGGKAP